MPGWDKIHYNRTIGAVGTPPDSIILMAVWWWWDNLLTPQELLRAAEELGPGAFASDFSDSVVGRTLSEHVGLGKRCREGLLQSPVWNWVSKFPGMSHIFWTDMIVPSTLASMSGAWLKSTPWWGENLAEMKRIKAKNKKVRDVLKS